MSSLEQNVCRNHGVEELNKNVSNWFVLSLFYVEINKFTNLSCTDCFSEAVQTQDGARDKAV